MGREQRKVLFNGPVSTTKSPFCSMTFVISFSLYIIFPWSFVSDLSPSSPRYRARTLQLNIFPCYLSLATFNQWAWHSCLLSIKHQSSTKDMPRLFPLVPPASFLGKGLRAGKSVRGRSNARGWRKNHSQS